jgi:DNA-binding transcriptional LysR family regulator
MVAAAKRLGVTQSAISQLVGSLERNCGVVLLDREFRPVRPTSAGRLLCELAEELLGHAHSVAQRTRDAGRANHTEIRLGCVDSFAATLGPALVTGLAGSSREIVMFSGITPVLMEQLRRRELDLAVCTDSATEEARIAAQLLFSENFVAVVPKARGRRSKDLASATANLPLVRYTRRSAIGQQIERYLVHARIVQPRRYEFDATDPLLSLVASGLGWAVTTPICIWQSRHFIGDLDVLSLPTTRLGQRSFFLLHRQGEWMRLGSEIVGLMRSKLERDLISQMIAAMPKLPRSAISFD